MFVFSFLLFASGGGGIDLSDFPSMFQTQVSKPVTPGPSAWRGIGVRKKNSCVPLLCVCVLSCDLWSCDQWKLILH